jgi:outer membrane protein TolC
MSRTGAIVTGLCLALSAALGAGCSTLPPADVAPAGGPPATVGPPAPALIQTAAYQPEPGADGPHPTMPRAPAAATPSRTEEPFAGLVELTPDALVREVLARNPTLAEMAAAAQAAAARYPQVTSLDDPILGVQDAPGAWGSNEVNGGVRIDVSQKYPWCGKLALRGANAAAEARAAAEEVEDARLQLAAEAREAFADYYLAARALGVNDESLRLLGEFKQNAEARYKTGKAPQQDILQADVEIGQARERRLTLERMREVAVARINTLMHLPPDSPLPPPPRELGPAEAPPDAAGLRRLALARRPDLKALADRVAAEQAAVALAEKEYKPDFEVMAAYDSLWQERPLRAQVGVRMNLPVRLERRHAAVAEAAARVAQRQAELARRADQVNLQVQEAAAQVAESARAVKLYESDILKAARGNVESARSAYTTGAIPFLTLIEAERAVVNLQDRYYEALAAYGRRRAALEGAVGGPLGEAPPASLPAASPAPGRLPCLSPAGWSEPAPVPPAPVALPKFGVSPEAEGPGPRAVAP